MTSVLITNGVRKLACTSLQLFFLETLASGSCKSHLSHRVTIPLLADVESEVLAHVPESIKDEISEVLNDDFYADVEETALHTIRTSLQSLGYVDDNMTDEDAAFFCGMLYGLLYADYNTAVDEFYR